MPWSVSVSQSAPFTASGPNIVFFKFIIIVIVFKWLGDVKPYGVSSQSKFIADYRLVWQLYT